MQVTEKGQIAIPQAIREKYGLMPSTEVEFVETGEGLLLRKMETRAQGLREWAQRVRGITKGKMTTDQVMQMTRGEEP